MVENAPECLHEGATVGPVRFAGRERMIVEGVCNGCGDPVVMTCRLEKSRHLGEEMVHD